MRILLSIKPEFASRIFDGSKRYEYRRVLFKRGDIDTVLVYASSPIRKVIGEFRINAVLSDRPTQLWNKTKDHAGISKRRFLEYFADKEIGYAIEVKNPQEYDVPLQIEDDFGVSPPQSFVYLPAEDMEAPASISA